MISEDEGNVKSGKYDARNHLFLFIMLFFSAFPDLLKTESLVSRAPSRLRAVSSPRRKTRRRLPQLLLCDFGFSIEVNGTEPLTTLCGTASYVGPEVVACRYYNGGIARYKQSEF